MNRFGLLLALLFASSFFARSARATPSEILIIRHAEKADGSHLDERGYERADHLIEIFSRPDGFARPDVIFAASPNKPTGSVRAIETVTPLAKALGVELHTEFAIKEFDAAADAIMNDPAYDGKRVLICWSHDSIPQLTEDLGAAPPQNPWPEDVYDRVWKIDFKAGAVGTAVDLPQHLLPGDS